MENPISGMQQSEQSKLVVALQENMSKAVLFYRVDGYV